MFPTGKKLRLAKKNNKFSSEMSKEKANEKR